MATITLCPSGSYRVQIRRAGFSAIYKSFKSKDMAQAWVRKTEYELDAGIFLRKDGTDRITFAELATRYINEISPKKKSHKQEAYRIRKIIREFKDYRIHQIKSMHIATYRDKLLKEGYAPSSVLNEISMISQVFELSIKEWGIPIASNPCKEIRKPKVNNQRSRRLSKQEEDLLLDCAKQSRAILLPSLISIALETGMRLGELLALTWDHVYLDRRFAYLPDTKNGASRSVPLSKKAIREFSEIPKNPDSNKVFWTWSHNKCLQNVWQRTCNKAGIVDLRFHDLRHEAISRMFEKDLNVMEVGTISGHKSLQMLKRYTHLNASDLALKLG